MSWLRGWVLLAEVYLEFLGTRCRPNTVLAVASDLRVVFTVVARRPDQVRPAHVLAFVAAQRTGGAGDHGVLQSADPGHELSGSAFIFYAGLTSASHIGILAGHGNVISAAETETRSSHARSAHL